jgi:hypothetical protein
MDTSSAVVEAEIADLGDISLSALAFGHDSEAVLRRVAGESAVRCEGANRAFNSALPVRD